MGKIGYICLKVIRKICTIILHLVNDYFDKYKYGYRYIDVKNRVNRIGGGYRGSKKEYHDVVLRYWHQYGKKPKKVWYDLYCNGLEKYDPRYVSDTIWFQDIMPHFNNIRMVPAYADKAIYNRILRDVKQPQTVVKRIGGYFYDGDGEHIISRKEAELICLKEEHLIFKPSNGSKGSGIVFYDSSGKNETEVTSIFDKVKGDFVAQRIIKQHYELQKLNPTSLNTVRLLSFHFKNEVFILSSLLRIGGAGSRIDNVSAGGSACAIYPNGWLHEQSVTRQSTWTDKTPNGIKLKTIKVPNYEKIVDAVKIAHRQLPYFNIIGWDFAVDVDGNPVMVEFNTRPGQNQISCGPTFGYLSEEVFEEVFQNTLAKKQKISN